MASQSLQLHFILFPLKAPGHMIPMIDIAKLLAQRGVIITIITTPVNALRFKPVIARAIESGLQIQFQEFQFPYAEAGLPEGCENVDMLPSLELTKKVLVAARMFQQPLEQLLKEMQPQPSCIISDMTLFFTVDVARKFHIPRIIFHGMCCFSLSCIHHVHVSKVFENATSESEYCVVPGLPDRVEFTKSQLSSFNANSSEGKEFLKKFMEAEKAAYGVVVNSFEELEPEYIKEYRKVRGDRVWCVGPVSLCNKDYLDKAERGNKASIDENQCFKWLDLWEPSSVIYACLGSLCNLITSQMIELGLGLEASNRPFIWVIKGDKKSKELEKWILEDGFEERTKGRGLVIQGWAPQVLILSHPSIGGFITHCGWNSTLEGICASDDYVAAICRPVL